MAKPPGRADLTSGGDPVGIEGLRQNRAREREEPSQVLGLTMMIGPSISILPSVGSAAMWYLIVFVIRYHLLFCDLSRPNVAWHMHTQPRSNHTYVAKGMDHLSQRGSA